MTIQTAGRKPDETGHQYLKRVEREAAKQQLSKTFELQLRGLKLPAYEKEFLWHPDRNYRADYIWRPIWFIVELDGGEFMEKSGHKTGLGITHDRIRDAEALILGYKVLRLTGGMVMDGSGVGYIEKLFRGTR